MQIGEDRTQMAAMALWCLNIALYFLFAGQVSVNEAVTALAVAAIATLWAFVIAAHTSRHYSLSIEHALLLLRALGTLPGKLARSFAALAIRRSSPGRARMARFAIGDRNDPNERTRRALAVLVASLAPDSYVIHADSTEERVFIHSIVRQREPDSRSLL